MRLCTTNRMMHQRQGVICMGTSCAVICMGSSCAVPLSPPGVAGSWIGLNAGMASLSVALAVVIFRTNLDTAVSEAEARTEEAHDNLHGHGVLREDGKGGHQQLEMVDVEGGLEDCH